jgi:RNA polymerase primary sigma factor
MTQVIGSHDEVSLMADDLYFSQVRQAAYLSREEEAVLLERVALGKRERMAACPDARVLAEAQAARDRLVEGFQGLVIAIAQRAVQRFSSHSLMDLVQEGNTGLLVAINDYDPMLGCPLRALASVCIRHALGLAWRERDGYVKLQSRDAAALHKIRVAQARFYEEHGRMPTSEEVAQAVGLKESRVHDLFSARRCWQGLSIQEMIERREIEEEKFPMVSLFEAVEVGSSCAWQPEQLRQVVDTVLSPVQRQVIGVRFGLDEEGTSRSQRETVKVLGSTLKSVQDAERKAKRKLARVLAASGEVSPVVSCVVCETEMAYKAGKKYCSKRCYRVANRRRKPEEVVS